MPYTNDPINSGSDQVRLLVGDTDIYEEALTDEVYNYIISKHTRPDGSTNGSAIVLEALQYLVAKYASFVTEKAGSLFVKESEKFQHYSQLQKKYTSDPRFSLMRAGIPFAGGIGDPSNLNFTFPQPTTTIKSNSSPTPNSNPIVDPNTVSVNSEETVEIILGSLLDADKEQIKYKVVPEDAGLVEGNIFTYTAPYTSEDNVIDLVVVASDGRGGVGTNTLTLQVKALVSQLYYISSWNDPINVVEGDTITLFVVPKGLTEGDEPLYQWQQAPLSDLSDITDIDDPTGEDKTESMSLIASLPLNEVMVRCRSEFNGIVEFTEWISLSVTPL